MFEILGLIPFLLILAALSTAIYLIFSKKEIGSQESPSKVIRRLYFYSVTLVGLLMTTGGTVQIIQFILEGIVSNNVIQQSPEKVASGVALIVVGAPLWGFHWHLINRNVTKNITERASGIRMVFIYSILFLSLAVSTNAVYEILQTIFGYKDSAYYQIAVLIPSLGIWWFHWRINSRKEPSSYAGTLLKRMYLYSASGIGLILMATGAVGIIDTLLQTSYDSATEVPLILGPNGSEWVDTVKKPLSPLLTGLLIWSTHWLILARTDSHNRIKSAFLYLTSIPVGGLISMLSGAILINAIIGTTLGMYDGESPPFLAISSILIGVLIIFYHWRVIRLQSRNADEREHFLPHQVFTNGFSFLGILFASPGIAILVYSILTFFLENPGEILNTHAAGLREPIVTGLTGLILGGSVWIFCQRKLVHIKSEAAANTNTVARIYYLAVVGIGLIVVAGALSVLIFLILTHILAARIGYETLQSIRIPLSLIAAFLVIVPYHWLENRKIPSDGYPDSEDQASVQKVVTIIAPPNSEFFLAQLEEDLGYSVHVRRWADLGASKNTFDIETTESIVSAIQRSPGGNVIVLPEQAGTKIYSYD